MQYICFDSVMIHQRKITHLWSFQRTLINWIEVRHISCQVNLLVIAELFSEKDLSGLQISGCDHEIVI